MRWRDALNEVDPGDEERLRQERQEEEDERIRQAAREALRAEREALEARLGTHLERLKEIAAFVSRVDGELHRFSWRKVAGRRDGVITMPIIELLTFDQDGRSHPTFVLRILFFKRGQPCIGFASRHRQVPYDPVEVGGVQFDYPSDAELTLDLVMKAVARWALGKKIELDLDDY